MFLDKTQEDMLNGEHGEVIQRCMRLLTRLGDIYHAENMIPVSSAQVAGVSYKSIGDPGLEFLEDFASKGAKVKVLTTLNPAGMDLQDWKKLGFPADFAEKQDRVIKAYSDMGIRPTVTCTPYYCGNLPARGDHIAWSESSAVSFANFVLGARTNREGGPSSLAAAICGITPSYGLHLDDKRKPTVVVRVSANLRTYSDFGALGYWAGKQAGDGIPYFTGLGSPSQDMLKGLGAAMAASGAVALYHVKGVTPEAGQDISGLEETAFGDSEKKESYEKLNSGNEPDIIIFGCPHASLEQVREISEKLSGKSLRKKLWVCCARQIKEQAEQRGYVRTIEEAGGNVVADTCMVVSPIERMGFGTTAVDSGKAGNYLPGFCRQAVVFSNADDLINEAIR
ncbi:MAG: aconitase X catalytic domain-containing protein [Candidatus Aenigmarchaeota archaeon]|nr:aconitase X catalytic domain-containing protein [Candidatus Aenigmarchaeota archaeon]